MGTLAVLIPNFNHGKYLKELRSSLANQSRRPDKIIVVDDGSTDDSVNIVESLASKY